MESQQLSQNSPILHIDDSGFLFQQFYIHKIIAFTNNGIQQLPAIHQVIRK